MASPVPVLTSTNQDDKIVELMFYGIKAEQVATGWRWTVAEKKIALSMGEVAAMRNYLEGLAKQVFPNSTTHYVVKGGVASLEHVLGIASSISDSISSTK